MTVAPASASSAGVVVAEPFWVSATVMVYLTVGGTTLKLIVFVTDAALLSVAMTCAQ